MKRNVLISAGLLILRGAKDLLFSHAATEADASLRSA